MKLNVDDLVEKGLVKKKTYTEGQYKGLSVLKYSRKVFYKNLWSLDERLLDCRGTVIDEEDNVIVLPFKKVFNYLENGTTVDRDLKVIAPRKVNGFMAAATMTKKYGLIVSTTGTLDSNYADLARKHIEKGDTSSFSEGHTYLFEICDKTDPHIVPEEEGAYLIGIMDVDTGKLLSEGACNNCAGILRYKRPSLSVTHFSDVLRESKVCKHEGFMVRDTHTQEVLCKLKSNHYLTKKAMQRISSKNIDLMYDDTDKYIKTRIKDEEFFSIVNHIVGNVDRELWKSYNDQQRRQYIEEYFNE